MGVVLLSVALLYESPGGNQVDGSPPVPTFCREAKRQFAFACRNMSVPEDQMGRGHSMTMEVTSHQYEHHSQVKYCKIERVIIFF